MMATAKVLFLLLALQLGVAFSCTCDQIEEVISLEFNKSSIQAIYETVLSIERKLEADGEIGSSSSQAARSCSEILNSRSNPPSDYYWVKNSAGRPHRVYCDMNMTCGGVTGGWMRVFELNMTNSSQQCPSGLRQRTDAGVRSCGIDSTAATCSSANISTNNFYTSKVCGRIKAYQVGSPDTFARVTSARVSEIDGNYLDGISLTHSNPRHHIWSFAAGLDEHPNDASQSNCPCTDVNTQNSATPSPSFVGNDYFCDTGSTGKFTLTTFHNDDPLWDGAGCGPDNSCCSFNSPPWFYKELPEATINDMELRLCRDEDGNNEDVPIEEVEIFIQ